MIKSYAATMASSASTQNKEASTEALKALSKQGGKTVEAAEKAASNFEALLLHQMLKEMWNTVEFSDMMGGDSNEAQIYRDMLSQALSDSIVEGRGIGVKDFLTKELLKAEGASKGKG